MFSRNHRSPQYQPSRVAICGHDTKDIIHVLRDCSKAKEVWKLVVPSEKQARFFSDLFQIWFSTKLCCHLKMQDKEITWSCLFGLIAWRIWKNRNLFIFQNINWTAHDVLKSSLGWAQHYEFFSIGTKNRSTFSEIHHYISDEWVHLFTDRIVARASGNDHSGRSDS
ncbi:hypothetical protein PVK06_044215 [Gossypium arboreum]|uniref:Reverse transcriptase zinc-binding domain-containing protein n=1 Tax=Gossypium arboreum TaxID=29729 RepID=A0ABR0MQK0_GOSAR|nr:hypothetical protein PVK06_044215 [Gossypium arboreum]